MRAAHAPSERLQALEVHKPEAKELAETALADHELGLAALPGARPLAARLSKLDTDGEALARWRKEVAPRLRAEVREHVAELDLPAALQESRNAGRHVPVLEDHRCGGCWGFGVAATISLIVNGAPWWNAFLVWLFVAIVTFCIALGGVDG